MDENTVITEQDVASDTAPGTDKDTDTENEGREKISSEGAECESDKSADVGSEETSDANELESLRNEVAALRSQLDEERAIYSRINAECAEFAELYPGVPISSLSDSIWDSVKKGVPIAAAYALAERRASVADMKANAVNSANRLLSSGSIDPHASEEYYSPDEVRSMTPAQVRANYSKIISSMSKWH